ncbi:hypothetical protein PG985_002148 [Apiospora marii]|uniref:uncharacterized protein n=1 Tax=Apiospora marii TaxID=335849 RepID=UPI00312E2F4C
MDFFKSLGGRKRQSKAVTPAAAATTAADTGQQKKAKSCDSLLPSPPQRGQQQQQQPQTPNNGSSPIITGPSFRQVLWESSSSPTDPVSSSSFDTARGGGERSPFDKRCGRPVRGQDGSLHASGGLSGLEIQPRAFGDPWGGGLDSGQPSPLCLNTPAKATTVTTPPDCEDDDDDDDDPEEEEPQSQQQQILAENFAARTHAPKPSLGRRGAIYVSPNRHKTHDRSPSSADRLMQERHSFDENGEISLLRNPPKSEFLGGNMKRWEALLAEQTAAAVALSKTGDSPRQEQQEEDDDGEREPSGIGNRANEEAVEAVRRLGRGEFQTVFSDFERAHTRSATLAQLQRQRTRSPNGEDDDPEQSEESGSSKHRPRSI